jgi:hypothetical protein
MHDWLAVEKSRLCFSGVVSMRLLGGKGVEFGMPDQGLNL